MPTDSKHVCLSGWTGSGSDIVKTALLTHLRHSEDLIVCVLLRQQLASLRVRSCPLMAASSRRPRACARRAPRESLRRREVLDAGYPTGRPSLPEAVSPGALRGGWIAHSDPSAGATE